MQILRILNTSAAQWARLEPGNAMNTTRIPKTYVPTHTLTLSDSQTTSVIIALTAALETYGPQTVADVHPESHIGNLKMILEHLKHAFHGRHTDFVKLKMVPVYE